MKPGQPTVSARKNGRRGDARRGHDDCCPGDRAGAVAADAATMAAESDFPHANAVVAEIARPHTEDKTPGNLGFADGSRTGWPAPIANIRRP